MITTKLWAGASLGAMTVSATVSAGPVGAVLAGIMSAALLALAAHEPTRRRALKLLGSRIAHVRFNRTVR